MTDTDRIAKAMVPPGMEQKKREENKPEEKVNEQEKNQNGQQNGPGEKNQNGQVAPNTPNVDPTPQNDNNDDDMSLVNEAMGAGLNVNTRGMDEESVTRDDLYKKHNEEISRLENEYKESTLEDMTADKERVGAKEVLEVPNYRQHVSDDQMQGWGRALASFGSVGLKQGANAIDAATKALGEFRKLTRAFLSPNPMSPISQTVASTMVGFNTMYDTIDRAGELAGIKQGADKSIVMETQKGAQYYKDKDNATKAANFIMQTFNDQIRDTLGPRGDVTQLNPAQFTRIYEKMKDGFFDSEMERIKDKHRTGQPLSLEDKAIVNGWKNLNENYRKVLKDKQSTANEYAKEVGVHEKAINDLDKKNKSVDAWKAGFDDAVKNKDSIGALIRMTLGPEANRRLKDGNVLVETLKGAQDQANSNATNPNFTPEQKEKWLKIANVFGKRVQTVRNMSTEQRRQYALRLSGTANAVGGAPKAGGRTSRVDDDPYGFLDATKKQREAIMNMTPKQYSDKKIAKWKENHVLETDQANSAKYRNLYKGAMDVVGKMAEEERKAYQNPRMTPEERAQTLEKMEGLKNRLFDLENTLWDRKSLETNDVFDESYRKVYNGMGREDYLKTLPKRKKEFPKAKGKSKSAKEYNILIDDYEGRKDELDMLRYDFLNGAFKDWRERRNAILRGRHLNRLLDDQRDRLSTMYSVLSKAGKKNGMLPGHSFERPEPSGEAEQVNEQRDVQEDTEQENKEDEAVGADVQGDLSADGTESEEEFNTISEDLKTIDKEGLERRIADLKGLDQGNPQVADLLRMAQERLDAKQSENSEEPTAESKDDIVEEEVDEGPVVEPEVPESDDTGVSEETTEPPVSTAYKTPGGVRYNNQFKDIDNNSKLSYGEKRNEIGNIISDVNKQLDRLHKKNPDSPTIPELEQLRAEMNDSYEDYKKRESSEFDRNQREENAENLKAAEEGGPNPEHGETFNADMGIDESKIRTPSEDPRKVNPKDLLGKLPEVDEAPKKDDRKETIAAISNLVESTLGEGSTVFRGLDFKKWYRNPKTKKISWKGQPGQVMQKVFDNERSWFSEMNNRITDSENPKELRKQIKARYNRTLKSLKFIKDNFSLINKRSKLNNELRWLKEAMEESFRFIYAHDPEKLGGLEPNLTAKESAERSKNPKPDNQIVDDGTTNARTNTKNSSKKGTRTRMTNEEKQRKIEETWKNNEEAFRMSNNEMMDALKAVKDKMSKDDLEKYLTVARNRLYDIMKNGGVSQEFKDELVGKFNELAPSGYSFEFNWDVKNKNDKLNLIRMKKLPNERSLGEKIADSNWTPSNKEVEYIKDNADTILRDHFGGDKEKLFSRFSFLRSATPSFEELLRAKLDERYGHFTG